MIKADSKRIILSLRLCVLWLLLSLFTQPVMSQHSTGSVGLLNVPTAENMEPGSIRAGVNFLPKEMLPPYFTKTYHSGNYYLSADIFSFLEITYRMTLVKDLLLEHPKYNQQDRAFTIRLQAIREGKYRPGFAIGTDDPMIDHGVSSYESYYAVLSKGLDWRNNRFQATVGYYFPWQKEENKEWKANRKGFFGGVSYIPFFCKEMKFMAEYDADVVNLGLSARFWKHLTVHAFVYDFSCVSAGVRYECVLKH